MEERQFANSGRNSDLLIGWWDLRILRKGWEVFG